MCALADILISQHLPPDYKIVSASIVIENQQCLFIENLLGAHVGQCIYQSMRHTVASAFFLSLAALSGPDPLQQVVLSPPTASVIHPAHCYLAGPGTAGASPHLSVLVEQETCWQAGLLAGPGTVSASHPGLRSLLERGHAVGGCSASTVLFHPAHCFLEEPVTAGDRRPISCWLCGRL